MTIHQKYQIKAPVGEVWRALVDPNEIKKWSGSKAEMDEQAGAEFFLWNGDVFGRNIEVVPNVRLVQEWYTRKWQEPSVVTFNLTTNEEMTELELIHENVPDISYEPIDFGWQNYYMGALKEYVERIKGKNRRVK